MKSGRPEHERIATLQRRLLALRPAEVADIESAEIQREAEALAEAGILRSNEAGALLRLASRLGLGEVARVLLAGGCSARSVDVRGRTALHYAARSWQGDGSLDIAVLLLDAGTTVDARDADGFTPLMLAAQEGHAHWVDWPLDAGADPLAIQAGRVNAAYLARGPHRERILELLRRHAPRRPMVRLAEEQRSTARRAGLNDWLASLGDDGTVGAIRGPIEQVIRAATASGRRWLDALANDPAPRERAGWFLIAPKGSEWIVAVPFGHRSDVDISHHESLTIRWSDTMGSLLVRRAQRGRVVETVGWSADATEAIFRSEVRDPPDWWIAWEGDRDDAMLDRYVAEAGLVLPAYGFDDNILDLQLVLSDTARHEVVAIGCLV